jgi:hypothetical protein
MVDPWGDILGDYRAFAARQQGRLLDRGIDIRPCTSASTRWGWSTSVWWSATHSTSSSGTNSPC